MGDPRLYQRSAEVEEFNTPQLEALIEDMFDTMAANDGAGLAAPQIGVLLRVVVFSVEHNPRYPDAETVPRTILINPQIEVLGDAQESGWEGCLSVPGMRGLVSRPSHIRYSGYDAHGKRFEREVEGFHARVVQHECDHLDGVLYPMRIEDIRHFGYESVLFGEAQAE
jgi:peptide deformylase